MSSFEGRRSVVRPRKVNGKGTAGEECLYKLNGVKVVACSARVFHYFVHELSILAHDRVDSLPCWLRKCAQVGVEGGK